MDVLNILKTVDMLKSICGLRIQWICWCYAYVNSHIFVEFIELTWLGKEGNVLGLEYASQAWSPYKLKDIKRIESVQRRFTKRLPGLSHLNYTNRLKSLGLETL